MLSVPARASQIMRAMASSSMRAMSGCATAAKLNGKPPALQDHTMYKAQADQGGFWKPEAPHPAAFHMPMWFSKGSGGPTWDPKQKSHQDWIQHVAAEMDNSIHNAGMTSDLYAKVSINGPKAREFMNKIGTTSVPKKLGVSRLGYVCAKDGELMNEYSISTRGENDLYYVGQGGWAEYELNLLNGHREDLGYSKEDVVLSNRSYDTEIIHTCGAKIHAILSQVLGPEAVDMKFLHFKKVNIKGIEMEIYRMSYAGLLGYEMHVPAKDAPTVYEMIAEHPASAKGSLKPHGAYAVQGLRLERFFRGSPETKKLGHYSETGIERFITADRTFVGYSPEHVPKKAFAMLTVDTPPGWEWSLFFAQKSPIFRNGEQVGETRTSAFGGFSKKTHAGALMYDTVSRDGLTIKAFDQEFKATIIDEPLMPFTANKAPQPIEL